MEDYAPRHFGTGNGETLLVGLEDTARYTHDANCCTLVELNNALVKIASATPSKRSTKSHCKRNITVSVSGSPMRQLYSITLG